MSSLYCHILLRDESHLKTVAGLAFGHPRGSYAMISLTCSLIPDHTILNAVLIAGGAGYTGVKSHRIRMAYKQGARRLGGPHVRIPLSEGSYSRSFVIGETRDGSEMKGLFDVPGPSGAPA